MKPLGKSDTMAALECTRAVLDILASKAVVGSRRGRSAGRRTQSVVRFARAEGSLAWLMGAVDHARFMHCTRSIVRVRCFAFGASGRVVPKPWVANVIRRVSGKPILSSIIGVRLGMVREVSHGATSNRDPVDDRASSQRGDRGQGQTAGGPLSGMSASYPSALNSIRQKPWPNGSANMASFP